ncbi:MAG: hypothetical protein GX660_27590, partial [Clostridiaceae bacterium]|nr:hypothetical protein [Clostridiaceae bacterium]
MNLKKLLKAAFKMKNFVLLSFILIVFYVTNYNLPFILIGAAGYIYFVMQTLKDEGFHKELQEEAKKNNI